MPLRAGGGGVREGGRGMSSARRQGPLGHHSGGGAGAAAGVAKGQRTREKGSAKQGPPRAPPKATCAGGSLCAPAAGDGEPEAFHFGGVMRSKPAMRLEVEVMDLRTVFAWPQS
jgi:hypothetical protein